MICLMRVMYLFVSANCGILHVAMFNIGPYAFVLALVLRRVKDSEKPSTS